MVKGPIAVPTSRNIQNRERSNRETVITIGRDKAYPIRHSTPPIQKTTKKSRMVPVTPRLRQYDPSSKAPPASRPASTIAHPMSALKKE